MNEMNVIGQLSPFSNGSYNNFPIHCSKECQYRSEMGSISVEVPAGTSIEQITQLFHEKIATLPFEISGYHPDWVYLAREICVSPEEVMAFSSKSAIYHLTLLGESLPLYASY